MFQRICTFLKNHMLFFIFSFLSLSFLIFQEWIWVYLDNRWLLFYKYFNNNILTEILYAWNNGTYFWFDKTSTIWPRAINTFLSSVLDQKIMFLLFFTLNYVFSYKLLRLLFSKKASILGALLFSFNPISIHFLNYMSFFFAYSSFPIVLYALIQFLNKWNIKYLLLLFIWNIFLFSYIRITGLYLTLLFLIWLFFHKQIFTYLKNSKKRVLTAIVLTIITSLPLVLWLVHPKINWDSQYFSWISNYAEKNINNSNFLYKKEINEWFLNWFVPKDIINNFATEFQSKGIFKTISFIFIFLVIFSVVIAKKKKTPITIFFLLVLLAIIFFRKLAFFADMDLFWKAVFKYYPFTAWELKWLFIIYIPTLVYLVSYVANSNKKHTILKIVVCIYMFISIFPLLGYIKNDKTKTVPIKAINQDYIKYFSNSHIQESTLFFPQWYTYKNWNILLGWSKYPLIMNYNNNYKSLLSNNYRLTNSKQNYLWKKVNESEINKNLSIFNLKNIFIFKDVKNSKIQEFDWYKWTSIEKESQNKYNKLRNNNKLNIKNENSSFANFWFNWSSEFEYFIYSPSQIERKEVDDLFKKDYLIKEKSLLIDDESFHKPLGFNSFQISKTNQNINISYKKTKLNPTKYYVKISNFDKINPFLLQLNQTFWMSWKIKWISESEYNSIKCIDDFVDYSVTDNSVCNYEHSYKDLVTDYKYLQKPEVKKENHFEWNFIWNTWMVKNGELPNSIKNNNQLYAVIIYEKQIYYIWALIIICLTFLILLLLSIIEWVKLLFTKKNEKK